MQLESQFFEFPVGTRAESPKRVSTRSRLTDARRCRCRCRLRRLSSSPTETAAATSRCRTPPAATTEEIGRATFRDFDLEIGLGLRFFLLLDKLKTVCGCLPGSVDLRWDC